MTKISMISLGCAKNMVDAEMALAAVLERGFGLALDPAEADMVLINTCGFIQAARDECREVIEEFLDLKRRRGPEFKVAVMGCWAERSAGELAAAFPGVDALWGLDIMPTLADAVARLAAGGVRDRAGFGKPPRPHEGARLLSTPPSFCYLKISDGCDNRCAYCAIPDIRGPFRSRPFAAVLDEARLLADRGVGELVVISQDTTRYGSDLTGEGRSLAPLLEALLMSVDTPRLRLLYAHPAHLDRRTVDLLLAEPRLCGYLDIPFQHVSDRVLSRMGRGYGRERIEEILSRFDGGGFTIRTTLLTGFPGEREEDFLQLVDLAGSGRIHHLGVFAYSPEAGTPAAAFDGQVPPEEAERRRAAVLLAQQRSAFAWLDSRVGGVEKVLVDEPIGGGGFRGRTRREAPDADGAVFLRGAGLRPGAFVDACIEAREGYDLLARPENGGDGRRREVRRSRRGRQARRR